MIRKTLVAGLILCIGAAPAFADGNSKEKTAGLGFGAIIGGVAGGPPGAIIGAAIGAKLGDNYHRKNEDIESLSASLDVSRSKVSDLERNIVALKGEISDREGQLQQSRELARPEIVALLQTGIEMDLLFRTDEHVLADDTESRLRALAGSLAANPDIRIQLDGFADERGDTDYNMALSGKRAEHVRGLLVANGVPAGRITVNAHGESPASEQSVDNFALERRVSMTLYLGDAPAVASVSGQPLN